MNSHSQLFLIIRKEWRVSTTGNEVRYSGEIIEDKHPSKAFKRDEDGDSPRPLLLACGTKVTGLTFPDESKGKGAFMDSDGQTFQIPLTRVVPALPEPDDVIITWSDNWEGKAKWDFEYCIVAVPQPGWGFGAVRILGI